MKRLLRRMTIMSVSAALTLLGFGGCSSAKKLGKEQARIEQERERQAYERQKEAMRQDSIRKAREDSIRIVRMSQTKCVYGGPNMMGRRPLNDSTNVEP